MMTKSELYPISVRKGFIIKFGSFC